MTLIPEFDLVDFNSYKNKFKRWRSSAKIDGSFDVHKMLKEKVAMKTEPEQLAELFSNEKLDQLFPPERSDLFFDALLGDPREGAYDIRLVFRDFRSDQLLFDLELHQRPNKCLACNLTYGLPTVFARHPVIDIQGVVDQIDVLLDGAGHCTSWKLGATVEKSRRLHAVPLIVDVEQ
jgi:hypothetical protein